MSTGASVAARVAGAVGALGYLTGLVDGPVIGALAGLGLVTFGRGLLAPRGTELLGPAAFGVLAGAAGSVALRWETLDLAEIQGAQGVLGPSIVVEPLEVAILSGVALVAATLSLGVWAGTPDTGWLARWWWVELVAGAFLLASLFSGPPPTDIIQAGLWLGATAVIAALALLVGRFASDRSIKSRGAVLVLCAAAVIVAAAVAGAAS